MSEPTHDAPASGGASYAAAGVDIEAGDRAVALMKEWVARATRPESVGALGGFAGLFDASALRRYRRPLLASATDGVGTKVAIAQRMDVHHTIGRDLVAMVADGMTIAQIVAELPDLVAEDVAEALRYAAQALRERELPLLHSA